MIRYSGFRSLIVLCEGDTIYSMNSQCPRCSANLGLLFWSYTAVAAGWGESRRDHERDDEETFSKYTHTYTHTDRHTRVHTNGVEESGEDRIDRLDPPTRLDGGKSASQRRGGQIWVSENLSHDRADMICQTRLASQLSHWGCWHVYPWFFAQLHGRAGRFVLPPNSVFRTGAAK